MELKEEIPYSLKKSFDKDFQFLKMANFGMYNRMEDRKYLEKLFKAIMKKTLNLDNPQTFNEKLQWLKLYNRKPEYSMMVDKYKVRDYIAEKLGKNYLIPLLGVWNDPEDIDFHLLPNQFVLKCNHNSGLGMCICRDKSKLDIKSVKKGLRKGLQQDYYLRGREWPYKNVPRRIIAEQYMGDASGILDDYKFMCFNGVVKCSFVCTERFERDGLKVTFFDRNWNVMPFERHYPRSSKVITKPQNYELMIQLAEKLSANIPFVRVDFYEIDGRVFFGELTFFPGSGFEEFTPESADYEIGKWLHLN